MDIKEVAQHLFPCWTMGLIMLYLVYNSKYRFALRVDKKGLWNFAKWMVFLTVFRLITLKLLAPEETIEQIRSTVNYIPWQTTFGVFWEDMCHTVPLFLASKIFKHKKWYKWLSKPLLLMMMASFGLGHMYQGWWACIVLAFYIPFTLRLGKKYGFGTVMLCHMCYDLATLFTLKWIAGA